MNFKDYFYGAIGKRSSPLKLLQEFKCYKMIPTTNNSYREDPGKMATLTMTHSHVFAAPNGKGKQLYAVNINGSGHDGSSGAAISTAHAEYFRSKGYYIPPNNILETIDISQINKNEYRILLD